MRTQRSFTPKRFRLSDNYMKGFLSISLLFSSLCVFAQGLNTELGHNPELHQYPTSLAATDDYSYVSWFYSGGVFTSLSYLDKIDTNGNVIWSSQVNPYPGEYTRVYDVEISETGGAYVAGHIWTTCDVSNNCKSFIQKFEPDGTADWSLVFNDEWCWVNDVQLSFVDDTLLMLGQSYSGDSTKIMRVLTNAAFVDSMTIGINDIVEFDQFGNSEFIAVGNIANDIYRFDVNGNLVGNADPGGPIVDFSKRNDTLFCITDQEVIILDTVFNVMDQATITGHGSLDQIRTDLGGIRFLGHHTNAIDYVELDEQLQEVNSTSSALDNTHQIFADFTDSHLGVAQKIDLTNGSTVRILDYSLHDPTDSLINYTDAGIVDVEMNAFNIGPFGPPGIYTVNMYNTVLVKNYGPNVLNSVKINRWYSIWLCNDIYYTEEFDSLNIAPGDSLWIDVGWSGNHTYAYATPIPDTLTSNICFFTSYPNRITDMNVSNDRGCREHVIGFSGMDEFKIQASIYPNPSNGSFQISLSEFVDAQFIVNDLAGKTLFYQKANTNNLTIDLADLAEGIYFLTILTSDNQHLHTEKIQILR